FFGLPGGLILGSLLGLVNMLLLPKIKEMNFLYIEPVEMLSFSWSSFRTNTIFKVSFWSSYGLFLGLIIWLIKWFFSGLIDELFLGLIGALLGEIALYKYSILNGPPMSRSDPIIWFLEQHYWMLISVLFCGVFSGLIVGLFSWLGFGLLYGLFFTMVVIFSSGMVKNKLITRMHPNEGIKRSLRNAMFSLWIFGLVGGLTSGLIGWQFGDSTNGLFYGVAGGIIFGLPGGLYYGGYASFKHLLLCILLWRNDFIPLNYSRFLDYSAERIFLIKIGGGYTFIHPIIKDYFALLES
ncbi:MAG: hypothetical protein KAR20_29750, partial [Candidatus Heimdallarchaeota archaeon]|nr:hypothetical protein [Candidatus Heimdallarchaeota archaeon]